MSKPPPHLYIDSNIYLNIWYREENFQPSYNLLNEIINCKYTLTTSTLIIKELSKKTSIPQADITNDYMKPYQILNKVNMAKITQQVADDATYLASQHGIHPTDALHIIMAKTNNCTLVTRDREMTRAAKQYGVKVNTPEELT
jgi:predicted nucleic acid-binding protein